MPYPGGNTVYQQDSSIVNTGRPPASGRTLTLAELQARHGGDSRWRFEGKYVYNDYNDESYTISDQQPQAAPPPAAAAPSAPRRPKARSALTAPAPAPFKQEAPTQTERDEITPPAKGLEATIKTSPKLLRERRRRSYLTS